jgi:hypothetical protein
MPFRITVHSKNSRRHARKLSHWSNDLVTQTFLNDQPALDLDKPARSCGVIPHGIAARQASALETAGK